MGPDKMNTEELDIWLSSRFQSEYLAMTKMKAEMDAHKSLLAQNSAENQELLLILRKVKTVISILAGIEKIAVWIAKIAVAVGLIWAVWKYVIIETVERAKEGIVK